MVEGEESAVLINLRRAIRSTERAHDALRDAEWSARRENCPSPTAEEVWALAVALEGVRNRIVDARNLCKTCAEEPKPVHEGG
jgi:hypothetical protein